MHTHLFNDGEYPRLVVVVTIGADAKIDLLWEGICLVGCSKLENAIPTVSGCFGRCGVGRSKAYLSGGARGTISHVSVEHEGLAYLMHRYNTPALMVIWRAICCNLPDIRN